LVTFIPSFSSLLEVFISFFSSFCLNFYFATSLFV
jgi:hypothetical protein